MPSFTGVFFLSAFLPLLLLFLLLPSLCLTHGHFYLWILDKLGSFVLRTNICEEILTSASVFCRSYITSKFQATSLYSLVSFLHALGLKFKLKTIEYDLKKIEISTTLFWNQAIKYLFIILIHFLTRKVLLTMKVKLSTVSTSKVEVQAISTKCTSLEVECQ